MDNSKPVKSNERERNEERCSPAFLELSAQADRRVALLRRWPPIGRSQHLINAMLAYFSFVAGASTSLVLIGKKMVSYYQHRIIA